MNASGRPNTCKSNGSGDFGFQVSGARVRNAYATYLILGYSPEKFGLIPHSIIRSHGLIIKGYGIRWACVPLARW